MYQATYVWEELALVNADDIVVVHERADLLELLDWLGVDLCPVMCRHLPLYPHEPHSVLSTDRPKHQRAYSSQ